MTGWTLGCDMVLPWEFHASMREAQGLGNEARIDRLLHTSSDPRLLCFVANVPDSLAERLLEWCLRFSWWQDVMSVIASDNTGP